MKARVERKAKKENTKLLPANTLIIRKSWLNAGIFCSAQQVNLVNYETACITIYKRRMKNFIG